MNIEYERNEFLASDECPWKASIPGVSIIGLGGSEQEAFDDLVANINKRQAVWEDILILAKRMK